MAGIFISYRREDSGGHAGRLCDRLTARFGEDRVFLDIQDIRPGQNFATSIEDTSGEPADVALDPEALLLQQQAVVRVRSALEQLPSEFREVIVLREIEGLSYKEIAAVIQAPIGTVMSRLARGRDRLASALRQAPTLVGHLR